MKTYPPLAALTFLSRHVGPDLRESFRTALEAGNDLLLQVEEIAETEAINALRGAVARRSTSHDMVVAAWNGNPPGVDEVKASFPDNRYSMLCWRWESSLGDAWLKLNTEERADFYRAVLDFARTADNAGLREAADEIRSAFDRAVLDFARTADNAGLREAADEIRSALDVKSDRETGDS